MPQSRRYAEWFALESVLYRDVDLVNLRTASTVFQNEVIAAGRRIHAGNQYEAEVFEMLVLSKYVRLNERRRGILDDLARTKRAYRVRLT